MKLKQIIPFLLSFPLVSAASSTDTGRRMIEVLERIFGGIFIDVRARLPYNLFIFYMRTLLWVLLFAILYYGVGFVIKDAKQKNIKITIAFVLALMTTVLIPAGLVEQIVTTYSLVGALLLIAIPICALLLINFKVLNKKERGFYVIKAILFYLVAVILYNSAGMARYWPNMADIDTWLNFGEGVCMIAMLYYLFRAIFGGEAGEGGGSSGSTPSWGGTGGGGGGGAAPGQPSPNHLRGYFRPIQQHLTQYNINLQNYICAGNRVLHAVNTGAAINPADTAAMGAEENRIDAERNQLQTLFHNLTSHADFARLGAGELRQVDRLMDRWTYLLVREAQYDVEFTNRIAHGGGPYNPP